MMMNHNSEKSQHRIVPSWSSNQTNYPSPSASLGVGSSSMVSSFQQQQSKSTSPLSLSSSNNNNDNINNSPQKEQNQQQHYVHPIEMKARIRKRCHQTGCIDVSYNDLHMYDDGDQTPITVVEKQLQVHDIFTNHHGTYTTYTILVPFLFYE
jgi:histone deacetylase complex regulatory component SIN3